MRAITIQQPYAFAVASGVKDVENRTRSIPWRSAVGQRVAIHAGKAWYDGAEHDDRIVKLGEQTVARMHAGEVPGASLLGFLVPQGHFLGSVVALATLAEVHWAGACRASLVRRQRPVDGEAEATDARGFCSAWAEPDCWHLVWTGTVALLKPVPTRGFQGLWTLPTEVEWAVAQQVGAA